MSKLDDMIKEAKGKIEIAIGSNSYTNEGLKWRVGKILKQLSIDISKYMKSEFGTYWL